MYGVKILLAQFCFIIRIRVEDYKEGVLEDFIGFTNKTRVRRDQNNTQAGIKRFILDSERI